MSLERQLANVHKPVAVVVLPMDAKRRTNTIAERSRCNRILLRKYFYPLISEPRSLDGHTKPKCKVINKEAALLGR